MLHGRRRPPEGRRPLLRRLDLVAEGEQERALAEYQHSLAADPVFTEAMHGMARTLQDLNRLDEAIAVAKRIAELDPDDVLALHQFVCPISEKGHDSRGRSRSQQSQDSGMETAVEEKRLLASTFGFWLLALSFWREARS
jgi:tetratricopeptide (TPR) repeat protein